MLAGQYRQPEAADGPTGGRGLAAADAGGERAFAGADIHRRQPEYNRAGDKGQAAPAEDGEGSGYSHHRLSAAHGVGQECGEQAAGGFVFEQGA